VISLFSDLRHFRRGGLFDPNLTLISEKLNLKPGIDMVGGVRLIYQIQPPPGQPANSDLATK